jgi:hypothetical protein
MVEGGMPRAPRAINDSATEGPIPSGALTPRQKLMALHTLRLFVCSMLKTVSQDPDQTNISNEFITVL